jgi:hypothetical protein
MKVQKSLAIFIAGLLISPMVLAVPTVPEIDGGSAAIALGLTIAVAALIRDKSRSK